MDIKDPKFFRLNFLCANTPSDNQSKSIIIKKTIQNEDKISKIKSNIISISQNASTHKYKKNIKHLKSIYSPHKKQILFKVKSIKDKTINNDIYKSYFIENIKRSNLYKYKNDNLSQLNFTINRDNFMPLTSENKYQNLYYRNKTFLKIDNSRYIKNNKDMSKITPLQQKNKHVKKIFCFNNNNTSKNLTKKKNLNIELYKFSNDKNNIRLLIRNKEKLTKKRLSKNDNSNNINNKTEYYPNKRNLKINGSENLLNNSQKRENDIHLIKNNKNSYNNKLFKKKEEIIQNLKDKIFLLEKKLEEIQNENDKLYKYKSLYDDKEIELIQYKNRFNNYKTENNNYSLLKYNYDELNNKYNDLYTKYSHIKEQTNELNELKIIQEKYNKLIIQNEELKDIKIKYNKIKDEYDELKLIREKYGNLLKEHNNLILIENKYNDLLEEVKDLREIKNEYEKIISKAKNSDNNIFKFNNISFGGEN